MTQQKHKVAVALALALTVSACAEAPTAPTEGPQAVAVSEQPRPGTGLVLDNLTGVDVAILGPLGEGEVEIQQAEITRLGIVELAGGVLGLQAEGVIRLTGDVPGGEVTQNFLTEVQVASTGSGCEVVGVDLGPIAVDAVFGAASIDVPQASVTPRASGAVAPLLCALGRAVDPLVGGVTATARALVDAINRLLI